MGVPPTGKQMTVSSIMIARIADGKIVEEWSLDDQMGMLQQLGVIPALFGLVFGESVKVRQASRSRCKQAMAVG